MPSTPGRLHIWSKGFEIGAEWIKFKSITDRSDDIGNHVGEERQGHRPLVHLHLTGKAVVVELSLDYSTNIYPI
jgi:hypothetical protein